MVDLNARKPLEGRRRDVVVLADPHDPGAIAAAGEARAILTDLGAVYTYDAPWHRGRDVPDSRPISTERFVADLGDVLVTIQPPRGYGDGVRNELDRLGAHILVVSKGCPYDAASHWRQVNAANWRWSPASRNPERLRSHWPKPLAQLTRWSGALNWPGPMLGLNCVTWAYRQHSHTASSNCSLTRTYGTSPTCGRF